MFSRSGSHSHLPEARQPRRAFVLVMVLALLTLCALCLAGLARRSLVAGEQAAQSASDLQRRWGVLSCLHTILPQANELLETAAAKLPAPAQVWPLPASVSIEFDLGELHFSVLVADEDAKANLNTICRNDADGPHAVAALVEELAAGGDGLAVHVEAAAGGGDANRRTEIFRGWGQVFEPSQTACPGEYAAKLRDTTRDMTCWGSGRLNVVRASDESLRLVCRNKISPDLLAKLLARRHDPGLTGLDSLLDEMALGTTDRVTLQRLLTDRSSRYSVWILVRSPQRTWATLALADGSSSQGARDLFTW
jgi:hypothetical protein